MIIQVWEFGCSISDLIHINKKRVIAARSVAMTRSGNNRI